MNLLTRDSETPATPATDTSEKPTVWYFIVALAVGGAERTLVDLVNNVDRDRYDVTVWTLFDDNLLADDIDPSVPIRTLGLKRGGHRDVGTLLNYVRAPLRFVRAVRRERPDIVQSFLYIDNTIARIAGLFAPETTIVTGIRGIQNQTGLVIRVLDRLFLSLSDYMVSNSEAGAEAYIERGVSPDRVGVVHNGRNLERFATADAAPLREELGLDDDTQLVGMVGRLHPQKGYPDLIEAWSTVRDAVPEAHLVLVGDGAERDALEAQVHAAGLSECIHFTGSRNDIPQVLAALDVFAFASHHEGLSGALLEAMAAGKPIVATAIPGNKELVRDGETATLVPVKTPAALARAIITLLEEPAYAAELGRAAREDATERFSLERMVGDFEAFYESVLEPTR